MSLILVILMWLLIVVAVEAITEIIVDSKIMFPIRDWFGRPAPEPAPCTHPIQATNNPVDCCKKSWLSRFGWWLRGFIGELIHCGYCASVWVAIPAAYFTGFSSIWMFIVKWMVIHRFATVIHRALHKSFRGEPFSFVFTHIHNNGDTDGSQKS